MRDHDYDDAGRERENSGGKHGEGERERPETATIHVCQHTWERRQERRESGN